MAEIFISRHDDPPGTWRISSNYFSTALRECAKATPGMRWDFENKLGWVGYPDAIEIVCKFLKERGVGYRGLRDMKLQALSTQHELPAAYKGLRDYQTEGVDFLISHGTAGVLLADEQGVGKSAQAIRAIRAFRKKTVIVCLSQAVGVWAGNDYMESQVKKWWPLVKREGSMLQLEGTSLPTHEWRVWRAGKKLQSKTVAELNVALHTAMHFGKTRHEAYKEYPGHVWRCSACGLSREYTIEPQKTAGCTAGLPKPSTRVVIVHYDILHAWASWLTEVWKCRSVIIDEIHEIQGERARRTKAVKELAHACDVRIGLTGTPMPNKPKDLLQTMNILSPGRFAPVIVDPESGKTKTQGFPFLMRYCDGHYVQVSLTKAVPDFKGRSNEKELARRMRFCMLRRTKAEVQKYLPPKIREIIDVKIPAKACVNVDLSVLKRSSVARQALALSADAKLPFVLDALREQVRAGDKIIAFTHRKLVAEHIADCIRAVGLQAGVVNGNVPQKQRDKRIADCKNFEGGYCLAATLETTSTGIDLSFANRAAYVEIPYEPHILLQSEDRLHRHGQKNTVTIQYFIGRGSIDDLIAQAVISKLDTFETIIGNTGNTLGRDLDSMPKGRAALDLLYETLRSSPG